MCHSVQNLSMLNGPTKQQPLGFPPYTVMYVYMHKYIDYPWNWNFEVLQESFPWLRMPPLSRTYIARGNVTQCTVYVVQETSLFFMRLDNSWLQNHQPMIYLMRILTTASEHYKTCLQLFWKGLLETDVATSLWFAKHSLMSYQKYCKQTWASESPIYFGIHTQGHRIVFPLALI